MDQTTIHIDKYLGAMDQTTIHIDKDEEPWIKQPSI